MAEQLPRLGAHMSAAGGLPRAVERARAHGCRAFQVFTRNGNQWRGRPLPREEVRAFRRALVASGMAPVVSHASYLINLAATEPALRRRSLEAMADELDRAEALGLLGVVLHPGCYTNGTATQGVRLVARALSTLLAARPRRRTMILLEHTAGQGTSLGARFEEMAAMIEGVDGHPRVGVCLDTCHLFASGYDIASPAGYAATIDAFDRVVGLPRLRVVHLNDSKRPLGSRVDRHAHIGEGCIGVEAFRRLVNDRRLGGLPMLLETPKARIRSADTSIVDPCDRRNLELLRSLVRSSAAAHLQS
jgi:deoxyribonuclease IV